MVTPSACRSRCATPGLLTCAPSVRLGQAVKTLKAQSRSACECAEFLRMWNDGESSASWPEYQNRLNAGV
jgi:hypothetical protein